MRFDTVAVMNSMTLKDLRKLSKAIIGQHRSFTAASMTGLPLTYGLPNQGELSDEVFEVLAEQQPTYVVFSYNTPIAWYGNAGWVIVNERFSNTTSKHQVIVRDALRHENVAELQGETV